MRVPILKREFTALRKDMEVPLFENRINVSHSLTRMLSARTKMSDFFVRETRSTMHAFPRCPAPEQTHRRSIAKAA
jgi:hypothetical protein